MFVCKIIYSFSFYISYLELSLMRKNKNNKARCCEEQESS